MICNFNYFPPRFAKHHISIHNVKRVPRDLRNKVILNFYTWHMFRIRTGLLFCVRSWDHQTFLIYHIPPIGPWMLLNNTCTNILSISENFEMSSSNERSIWAQWISFIGRRESRSFFSLSWIKSQIFFSYLHRFWPLHLQDKLVIRTSLLCFIQKCNNLSFFEFGY